MSWADRLRLAMVLVIGWVYTIFEFLEDYVNERVPFDDVFGLGVAVLSWFILVHTTAAAKWQAYLTVGLWIAVTVIDWFSKEGSMNDEFITMLTIITISAMLLWPILRRVRFDRDAN
jgi:uncharacterized membrane protein